MEFLASRSPLLPAFVVLGLLFYVINSWFAARSAAEQKRRLADAPTRKRIVVGPTALPASPSHIAPSGYQKLPERTQRVFDIPAPGTPPVNRQLFYESPAPRYQPATPSVLSRPEKWTPDNRVGTSAFGTPVSVSRANDWTPDVPGPVDSWYSPFAPRQPNIEQLNNLFGGTRSQTLDPFHNSFDAAEQSASTPVAPTQQSVSASPAVQAEASIPSKPLTQKRTRMDELKADGIVKPQIIADTLQPERGSLRPSTPTPGAAQEPSQPEPESVPMDTSESTALVSTTTPGKRKRGSNSYGLYDDDDMPRTVSPRRPRSMYTRGTSAWRGPKVTYNLAKRIVEEEMIPERPGKKRRTIVEFYESPEVVLFEPPPGPRRVELDGDAEMGESPAFGEREVAAPRPIKSVEQIRQAKEVREKRPMSAAKKAFLEELEKDEVEIPPTPAKGADLNDEIVRAARKLIEEQGPALASELREQLRKAEEKENAARQAAAAQAASAAAASKPAAPAFAFGASVPKPSEFAAASAATSSASATTAASLPAAPLFGGLKASSAAPETEKPTIPSLPLATPVLVTSTPLSPQKTTEEAPAPPPLFGGLAAPASKPPAFSFGGSSPAAEAPKPAEKPVFAFGASSAAAPAPPSEAPKVAEKPLFSFGAPSAPKPSEPAQASTPTPAAPVFGASFGAPKTDAPATSAPVAAAAPAFTFGLPSGKPAETTPAASTPPLFGAPKPDGVSSTANATTQKSAAPMFGASAPSSTGPAFSFGAPATSSTTPATTAPAFGSTLTTSATPAAAPSFTFGAPKTSAPAPSSTTAPSFSFTPSSSTTSQPSGGPVSFSFSKPDAAAPAAAPSSFGASTSSTAGGFGASTNTAPSGGFGFGTNTASAPSGFGASTSATPATGGFGFGAQPSTGPTTTGFGFGAGTASAGSTAPPSPFLFGQQQPASTQASGFGASTASSTGFGFGASTSGAAASSTTTFGGFGSSTNQAPAFGSSTNQAPAFGSSSTGFGAQNASQQPPAFGGFGAPGGTPGTPGGFGAQSSSASLVSQPSNAGFNFGASTGAAPSGMFQFGGGGSAGTSSTNLGSPALGMGADTPQLFNIGAGGETRKIAAPKRRLNRNK